MISALRDRYMTLSQRVVSHATQVDVFGDVARLPHVLGSATPLEPFRRQYAEAAAAYPPITTCSGHAAVMHDVNDADHHVHDGWIALYRRKHMLVVLALLH